MKVFYKKQKTNIVTFRNYKHFSSEVFMFDVKNSIFQMIQSILQHECQTRATRVRHERHECNTSDMSVIRVRHQQHECDTNATRGLHERHERDTSVARVRNFDFDNDTSENIFLYAYISLWQIKDYKERNNFILRTIFWKCLVLIPKCVAFKMK